MNALYLVVFAAAIVGVVHAQEPTNGCYNEDLNRTIAECVDNRTKAGGGPGWGPPGPPPPGGPGDDGNGRPPPGPPPSGGPGGDGNGRPRPPPGRPGGPPADLCVMDIMTGVDNPRDGLKVDAMKANLKKVLNPDKEELINAAVDKCSQQANDGTSKNHVIMRNYADCFSNELKTTCGISLPSPRGPPPPGPPPGGPRDE